jgi:hypothetical protein
LGGLDHGPKQTERTFSLTRKPAVQMMRGFLPQPRQVKTGDTERVTGKLAS